ncbi:MAG: amidohydrolase [Candidatus Glassbacteria bacterium]|nr:amidohydrolase [Candidatus Glassbacteria bacterium]
MVSRATKFRSTELGKVKRVIDVYANVGTAPDGREFTAEGLIGAMEEAGIEHAIISSISGGLSSQQEANREAAKARNRYPSRFACLVWVNPGEGKAALDNAKECINTESFVGLKFHPFLNRFHFNDKSVYPFMKLAGDLGVPVLVHTAHDEFSLPVRALDMARRFPEVPIIMGHAGLSEGPHHGAFNLQTMIMAAMSRNLYVDTSWVDPWALRRGLGILSSKRILFGTDAPLGGARHYDQALETIDRMELKLPVLEDILWNSAVGLFKPEF